MSVTRRQLFRGGAATLSLVHLIRPAPAKCPMRNVTIYAEKGRFGGWPANHGIWGWGDEIVVGFTVAHYAPAQSGHAVDRSKPFEDRQARSLDGGRTWTVEQPPEIHRPETGGPTPVDCPGGIDFEHPDFAMMMRHSDSNKGPSRFYYTQDRCKSWKGPYRLPGFGQKGIAARTDYLVEGKHQMLACLTAAKSTGGEGRPFCARTKDGAKTWEFVSWIGPEPKRGYAIMPATVRLSGSILLTIIRCKNAPKTWLQGYLSSDNGASWNSIHLGEVGYGASNPPSLIKLRDGRLCLTYGFRSADPRGIRARVSSDQGKTWSREILLRSDGSTGDLGYPRSIQRPDGKVVSVYYFNGPWNRERTVEATIWDPDCPPA